MTSCRSDVAAPHAQGLNGVLSTTLLPPNGRPTRAEPTPAIAIADTTMPSTNARRSKRHEREIVHAAEDAGLGAERAWNSDGRSLGENKECDVRLETPGGSAWTVQAKRRKTVAGYLTDENADVVVTREDYGDNLVVCPLGTFLDLLTADTDQ